MSNIISLHRHIQRQSMRDASRELKQENQQLRAMLAQRGAALLAIINRVGPQTFTGEDLAAVPKGAEVLCAPEGEYVTFSVVKPEETESEPAKGNEP